MSALSDLERRALRALLAERRAWARWVKTGADDNFRRLWTARDRLRAIGDELLAASRKRGRGGER